MPAAFSNPKSEIRNPKSVRRLIVNADDFGQSTSSNEAVIRAHREGILTSASLMVNESVADAAVALAKKNPKLGVGLHLTLVRGHSALPPEKIPGLVNSQHEFSNAPIATGCRYFFCRELRDQLRAEIHAQFEKFRATGLLLDHVNGHLHFHLHPAVLDILMEDAAALGIRHLRLMREPYGLDAHLAYGHRFRRASHALIFNRLARRAHRVLQLKNIRHTENVFGLLQNARVSEDYVLKLLPALPPGDSELYSHPSLDKFKHEFEALISPRVSGLVRKLNIQLIRYQDL